VSDEFAIATPEQAKKFTASLHAHEKCPALLEDGTRCGKEIGTCEHRCGRDYRSKDVADPPHAARPWGYKGPMVLPKTHN
jgi:hypothetical protein